MSQMPRFWRPNDPFPTADAAAFAAIDSILTVSILNHIEYAGHIFERPNGTFGYTPPRTEHNDHYSHPGPAPVGVRSVGTYHTHAGAFCTTDEIFAPDDLLRATLGRHISFLGTPRRRILKFTPVDLLTTAQMQTTFPRGRVQELRGPISEDEAAALGRACAQGTSSPAN